MKSEILTLEASYSFKPNDLVVRYKEEDPEADDRFELVLPLLFLLLTYKAEVVVPAGYTTDFASVPRWLWSFFPSIGRYNRIMVLHDWWYDNRLFEVELGLELARYLADKEMLLRLNALAPKRKIRNYCMYLACRWFGRKWWLN